MESTEEQIKRIRNEKEFIKNQEIEKQNNILQAWVCNDMILRMLEVEQENDLKFLYGDGSNETPIGIDFREKYDK